MRKTILTTMVLVILSSVGFTADWKYFGTDSTGSSHFYDLQSISQEEGITRVSVKIVLSDVAKEKVLKVFNEYSGITNLSYCVDRLEIHRLANMFKITSRVWFSSDDRGILRNDLSNSQFEDILQGTLMVSLREAVSKKDEKPTPEK